MKIKSDIASGAERDFVSRADLARTFDLDPAMLDRVRRRFPVLWPRYYFDLARGPGGGPMARMGLPRLDELDPHPGDLADPIADQHLRPVPFVVRKHRDRVIVLATKTCHFYCRFCFRREEPVGRTMEPGVDDWRRIYHFLENTPDIEEAILSGGDPLTMKDDDLFRIGARLAAIPHLKRWRIHTRAPVHYPARVTPALVAGLAHGLPLRVVTHFNHGREITDPSRRAVSRFTETGIATLNQAVLLRGVNDDPKTQLALWSGLTALGVSPYYLHHPDRAAGNAAFRVTIHRGLAIYRAFLSQWQGLPPRYVLDLPDGRGKVPVTGLREREPGVYLFDHNDGHRSTYHDLEADLPPTANNAGESHGG